VANDNQRPKPRPLGEAGLSRVLGGVGPLSPEDLAIQRERIVIDLGRVTQSKKPPTKRK
jgi:hypothetical protein